MKTMILYAILVWGCVLGMIIYTAYKDQNKKEE